MYVRNSRLKLSTYMYIHNCSVASEEILVPVVWICSCTYIHVFLCFWWKEMVLRSVFGGKPVCMCTSYLWIHALLSTEATVGFENTSYTVVEDGNDVEICVVVHQPGGQVPIGFPFMVEFATGDGTAGNSFYIYNYVHTYILNSYHAEYGCCVTNCWPSYVHVCMYHVQSNLMTI